MLTIRRCEDGSQASRAGLDAGDAADSSGPGLSAGAAAGAQSADRCRNSAAERPAARLRLPGPAVRSTARLHGPEQRAAARQSGQRFRSRRRPLAHRLPGVGPRRLHGREPQDRRLPVSARSLVRPVQPERAQGRLPDHRAAHVPEHHRARRLRSSKAGRCRRRRRRSRAPPGRSRRSSSGGTAVLHAELTRACRSTCSTATPRSSRSTGGSR